MTGWLRILRPSGAGQSVVCLPHAGGSASWFAGWARHLGAAPGLIAVQYPGRADRAAERPATDVASAADRIAAELRGLGQDIVLFGHSMGAAIAHEVALRLAGDGRLAGLAVSAHAGPDDLKPVVEHLMPDDELWAAVRDLNGTDDRVLGAAELRDLLLPLFRADFALAATYQPRTRPALGVPVLALAGENDPEVSPEEMLSWRHTGRAGFTLRTFPGGDHFYLTGAVTAVTRAVTALLPEPRWPSMP
jgi:pyochelin biosynthetic protein PchC